MAKKRENVLIIKTGYSEVLDKKSDSRKVSLGDVFRSTVLLHLYKKDNVTWVTDKQAFPLLEGNPYINRLLPHNFTTAMNLLDEDNFDTIINLEKNHDICKLSNKINSWRKYGFRFDKRTNSAEAYDRASEVLAVGSSAHAKKWNNKPFQEFLFEMVGAKWNKEEYILGYKPTTTEAYDIGLNTQIGQKWPTKAWPMTYWDKIEGISKKEGFKITRQDRQSKGVLTNLYKYMDWINSSKLIVTNDSLGLHLAIALKKKVLGLFGSTPLKEVYFYNRGKAILPEPLVECMPCFKSVCDKEKECMRNILPEKVYREIKVLYES